MHVKQIIKNIKKININIKSPKTYIGFFIIVLIIFLGGFWWYRKKTFFAENFIITGSDTGGDPDDAPEKPDNESATSRFLEYAGGNATDGYSFGGLTTGLDAAINALTVGEAKKPQWNDLEYDDGEMTSKLNLYTIRDISNLEVEIVNDNCSKRSLLKSDYKDDICEKYIGDYSTINEKCRGLNMTTCPLTKCCVLLNGNKCVAGNVKGPTYYTDNGIEIEFDYYEFRGKRYPELSSEEERNNKCAPYAENSTGISQDCMIQLFNKAGCSNDNPDKIITDAYVNNNIKSTKRFIRNDLTKRVQILKNLANDDEVTQKDKLIMCSGPVSECDKFYSYDTEVSSECMSEQFEKERLRQLQRHYELTDMAVIGDASLNQIPSFITDDSVELMKTENKSGVFNWIKTKVEDEIFNNVPCSAFYPTDINISKKCMRDMFKEAGCPSSTPDDYFNRPGTMNGYGDLSSASKAAIQLQLNSFATLVGPENKDNLFPSDYSTMCYGRKNVCDNYYWMGSSGIRKDCMQNMFDYALEIFVDYFNQRNTSPNPAEKLSVDYFDTFIDDAYVIKMAAFDKRTVFWTICMDVMKLIKNFTATN
jgi:hypothetical protein